MWTGLYKQVEHNKYTLKDNRIVIYQSIIVYIVYMLNNVEMPKKYGTIYTKLSVTINEERCFLKQNLEW